MRRRSQGGERRRGGKGRGGRQGGTHVAHLVTVCLHDLWVARVDLLSEVLADELQNGIMCQDVLSRKVSHETTYDVSTRVDVLGEVE